MNTHFQDKVEERKLMKIIKLYRSIPADASQLCLYISSLLGLRLCNSVGVMPADWRS